MNIQFLDKVVNKTFMVWKLCHLGQCVCIRIVYK